MTDNVTQIKSRAGRQLASTDSIPEAAEIEAGLARLRDPGPAAGMRRIARNRIAKSSGRDLVVAITGGKLDFRPWEQIFYGEFDGGRRKRVLVKIIGE